MTIGAVKAQIRSACWKALRQLFVFITIVSLLVYVAGAHLSTAIFSPPRTAIYPSYSDRLETPEKFGLSIQAYACLGGKSACLLVEPKGHIKTNRKGQVLRHQLSNKGLPLSAYGNVKGMLVLLHGRNGRKENLLPVAERFVAAGFRCLIPDLPAHGEHLSNEMHFGAATEERVLARQLVLDAKQRFQLPNEPVGLWGISMGGAFAVSAASESPDFWKSVIVVSSFDRLDQVLVSQLPDDYRLIAKSISFILDKVRRIQSKPGVDEIQPARWAKTLRSPIIVFHGDADSYVSMTRGKALFNAVAAPDKRWVTVTGGGHRNVLNTSQKVYAEMGEWLITHML